MPLSKRNRRGVLILFITGAVICFSPRILAGLQTAESLDISFEEAKVVESKITERKQELSKKKKKKRKKRVYKIPNQKFDPNDYQVADWMKLGLSEKQANVIVRFSERGLRSNDDLEKIYVLPTELFDLIKDSTYYTNGYLFQHKEEISEKKKERGKIILPLNQSDAEALQTIPGIGPYFSRKIIHYREKLGGYVRKEQLLEIWKLDIEKYEEIKGYLELGATDTRKLSINSASIDELKAHPYINYNIANSIVKLRAQNGPFEQLEDIKQSRLIDEITYRKIKPYLSL